MPINSYIENIAKRYALGNATEHTFRGDLQHLIEELVPEVAATNEPKRIDCGAPDFVLTRKDIPVGYIEAKDVGKDLDAKEFKEQFDRYRDALDNLVITDNLDFRFYINGEPTASVKIAEVSNGKIIALPENFTQFTNLIKEFCSRTPVTIKSSKRLAEMMAEKAKILAYIIKNALDEDIAANVESDLTNQMKAFKDILIHDIDAKAFADIYAQTIAYGMFAARLHDPTLPTFSRQEAAELIPKTNPFLRKLFQFIAAFDLDTRIDWIVDALADLFRATDIAAILKNFGKSTQTHDPIMHFYETFLAEYDPKLRKSRGVFYTPEPVVDFIVRAVDDILKSEFNLPNGLADTSKTKIKVDVQGRLRETEVHKVQILDPATGTGTFLATVIKHIYKGFENQQGVWNQYVDEHLIPRLNGFELLMASYAMAHLKLDLLLTELATPAEAERVSSPTVKEGPAALVAPTVALPHGRATDTSDRSQRFQIYLTNALEEYHPDTGTLFASWLSTEANEANHIKRDTPVMVVIGNPPYSVSSCNKSEWIEELLEVYRAGVAGFNKNSLSDDYVKFIRYGQYFVDKNKTGVLAYISNNSFLDGITHNCMRRSLMKSFDKIYVIDLHGSLKKLETTEDGGTDENVFDIQQGVSINIFIKNGEESDDTEVKVTDIYGKREEKYKFLEANSLSTIDWVSVKPEEPTLFFKPFDYEANREYEEWLSLSQLFKSFGSGIKFRKDNLLIKPHFDKESVNRLVKDMAELPASEILSRYKINETDDWTVDGKRKYFRPNPNAIRPVQYRLFDRRFTYFPYDEIGEIIVRGDSRRELMRNLFDGETIALLSSRQQSSFDYQHVFVSKDLVDMCTVSLQSKETTYAFPLYLYAQPSTQPTLDGRTERVPNLNSEIVDKIADAIGLTFTNEEEDTDCTFAPIDILDYVYAVLHSPSYREKYKEFLKIDFPRVPYPQDAGTFWQLVALGGDLRQIHLLESPKVNQFITGFPVGGDNTVEKIAFESEPRAIATGLRDGGEAKNPVATAPGSDQTGRVFFNDTQYFSNVPETAWNFYIGGYQPAQKWLKDRKGRQLSYDDIQHYQKMIVALTETDRIMSEIDRLAFV